MKWLGVLVLGLALAAPVHALKGRLLVDGIEGGTMDPLATSRWTLGFRTDAGAPQIGFEAEHQKYMHLIVVPADLSSFAHVHPGFAPGTGTFTIDVNAPGVDADNLDAARVVTRPGPHFVFAEVKPRGADLEQHRFTVRATGAESPVPPVAEDVDADGWITHVDGAHRVRLKPEAIKADMVHLTFRVETKTAAGWVPVNDLESWLGMSAHAVMIGAAGDTAGERVFRHLHAGHGDHVRDSGEHILFMLHGDDVPPSGVYRVWLQVKRQGRVLTFPFTVAL